MRGEPKNLQAAAAPHVHVGTCTAGIMGTAVLCLLPAGAWGVFVFGAGALKVVLVSIAASLLTELLLALLLHRFTLMDGSALVTGLLVGYTMPASVPLYIPAAASVFAIAVAKMSFGGLGRNWMNPALAGRAFVAFSWAEPMAVAAAPLALAKAGMEDFTVLAKGPMDFLIRKGYPTSAMDRALTGWLNEHLLAPLGTSLPGGYLDLLLGNVPGCIGEVSALLLLLGGAALLARKIVRWETPVSYLGVFGLLVWVFGGLGFQGLLFRGDVAFQLFSGGLILGAFYMAPEPVTSPLTRRGRLIYGAGCGLLTFLIRFYGSLAEGVYLAIIFMNMFVPLINRFTRPRRFGLAGGLKA